MSNRIAISQLSSSIVDAIKEYTEEVEEGLEEAKEKVAKDTVQTLKSTSPKKSGAYAKSWRVKKVGKAQVVHVAAPHYRVSHLLEKGFAKRGGGRVAGKPHIGPAEEQAIKQFEDEVERVIRG